MSSQPTTKQHHSRIRIKPSALCLVVFLAGLIARPYLQFCLRDAAIELSNDLSHPANQYGGLEAMGDEKATELYTPSELAEMERIDKETHPVGQATLVVIVITIVVIFVLWAGRIERRPSE